MKTGLALQRLFSTFPDSWPGLALFLLRLGTGIFLICLAVTGLPEALGEPMVISRDLIASATGVFLLAGLWTPAAGALAAFDELWNAWSMYSLRHGDVWIHVFVMLVTVCLAMLGPGAWSVDARLYGRKRFKLGNRLERNPSK